MADRDFILAPATTAVTVRFGLEPVFNALNSLSLLATHEARSGLGEWIVETAAALPRDVYERHRLIFWTELCACGDLRQHASFPAYLDWLAAQDSLMLPREALKWLYEDRNAWLNPPPYDTLVSDRDAYLGVIERLGTKKAEEKPEEKDSILEMRRYFEQAFDLLQNPPALKTLVLDHLRLIWHDWLAPEWDKVQPMLRESIAAFQQLEYRGMSPLEAIRAVTSRDLSGIWDDWKNQLVFVPSAHIGPYVSWFNEGDTTYMIFGARLPEGARVTSPALSRSELLVRLSALADDTRLQILELLTKHSELCAQDVIEMLDLSQSAASRHLRQLTATGYLIERRREVAKCYSLNPQRVDDTLHALKRFLRK